MRRLRLRNTIRIGKRERHTRAASERGEISGKIRRSSRKEIRERKVPRIIVSQ